MITKSIRDANIDHIDILEGDYIGFSDKTMYTSNKNKLDTYFDLIDKLDIRNKQFLINVYGNDVSLEEKEEIRMKLKSQAPTIEFYEIDGGQEVYDFIIILE